jgi:uncharacterized protein YbjT (DUF2867 family)
MKRILVIGGTGNVGAQVVYQLLEAGVGVQAFARRPEAAGFPAGVELLKGDLTEPNCFDRLGEFDAAFLIWCAPLSTAEEVVGKLSRKTGRIVFLSNMTVRDDVKVYDNRESTTHFEIERLISQGPCQWTFLRAGVFANNARLWWGPQIRTGNVVRWPYGAASTAPVHERDLAAVAVRALVDPGHHRAKYVLTGPEALRHLDQVRIIGEVLNRPIKFDELTPETAASGLFKEWPAPIVQMLLAAWPKLIGTPVTITSTVAEVTGVPARSFRHWVQDHRESFKLDSN